MSKIVAIIPARYASTRFPGKPLAMLGDKPMIQHVYERASQVIDNVYVATDDERIYEAVEGFGGRAVMTSTEHRSGTDRCREAVEKACPDADIVINIQGDEPFVAASQLEQLAAAFDNAEVQIATLARKYDPQGGFDGLFDPNLVKVVFGNDGRALYFSRSIIPYVRSTDWHNWLRTSEFYTHVGMYAYRRKVLEAIASLPQSPLEIAESLEQLRWLSNGYNINVSITEAPTIGIDTPADLEAAKKLLEQQ